MKYKAITENHLYSKAYAKGKKFVGKQVVVYVLQDYHAARLQRENPCKQRINRIGLTVGKKIGGAVTRNRVKRIIREAYRQMDTQYGIKKGFLIVIVAREAAVPAKTPQIQADLSIAFSKLAMRMDLSTTKN